MEFLRGKLIDEVFGSGLNCIKNILMRYKLKKMLKETITIFNENYKDTEIDSEAFRAHVEKDIDIHRYFFDYLHSVKDPTSQEKKLEGIIESSLEIINRKRLEQGVTLLKDKKLLRKYFDDIKNALDEKRLDLLGTEKQLLAAQIDKNARVTSAPFSKQLDRIEGFVSKNNQLEDKKTDYIKVGVRTYPSGTEKRIDVSSSYLDLSEHFTYNGNIIDEKLWNEVIGQQIKEFVEEKIESDIESLVSLDAVQSVAFTLGFYAHEKSNRILYPIQNHIPWTFSKGKKVGDKELKAELEDNDGDDLLIIIDLMDSNLCETFGDFLDNSFDGKKYAVLKIQPDIPDKKYIIDGEHCMKLVYEIDGILQKLSVKLKRKRWYFAFKVPNSFVFLLGKQATQYGHITLLHFDEGALKYRKSINLGGQE